MKQIIQGYQTEIGDTAEAFAKTINQLKGKVTMLFITHALPKALRVDGVLKIGKQADGQSSHEVKDAIAGLTS
jgi:ATP-binding cassette, subfamily B, bacterial HlyB/CyaB